MSQLLNEEGVLLSYRDFSSRHNPQVTPEEFSVVTNAIPSGVLMLFKNSCTSSSRHVSIPYATDSPEGNICFSLTQKNNNKRVRALFQKDIVATPNITVYWNRFTDNIDWKKTWMLPNTFLISNKVKEVSYKIIHKYYPANHYMQKFKKDININCSFCNLHPETVVHLFWLCSHTKKLWADLSKFIIDSFSIDFILLWENVVFGFHYYPKKEGKCYFLINLFLFLAKFHIHKSTFSKKTPCFYVFQKEMELYFKLITKSTNGKAIKTIDFCNMYNLVV